MSTTRDIIKSCEKEHLIDYNGLLFSQNLIANAWINDTIPSDIPNNKGLIELPTSDVSNAGIVVGAALAGRKPIYVIRYQGFTTFNNSFLVNYAAKSKFLWQQPCPVFIRALSMENGIGPVATGSHHSAVCRYPGIKVFAPITPLEWETVWNKFLQGDDPVFCSESRLSFPIDYEMEDIKKPESDVIVFAISTARLNAIKAIAELENQGIVCSLIHLVNLKPFEVSLSALVHLTDSKIGVVIDSDYEECGISQSIAHKLMLKYKKPIYSLGLEDRTAGFASHCDNITPSIEKIVHFIKEKLNGKN